MLQVAPAPRGTLQDHVYRQLCELILNGEIAPGQLITMWPRLPIEAAYKVLASLLDVEIK